MTRNSRRDFKAGWPIGWQDEVQRLAELYANRSTGHRWSDQSGVERKGSARELAGILTNVNSAAQTLEGLLSDEHIYSMVRLATARADRYSAYFTDLTTEEMGAYVIGLRSQLRCFQELGEDIALVLKRLKRPKGQGIGNQSNLPMRSTIFAAAEAYYRLFGKPPGRSKSDSGTFGKFLAEIFVKVPIDLRPAKQLSNSAIAAVVADWCRRRDL